MREERDCRESAPDGLPSAFLVRAPLNGDQVHESETGRDPFGRRASDLGGGIGHRNPYRGPVTADRGGDGWRTVDHRIGDQLAGRQDQRVLRPGAVPPTQGKAGELAR